MYMFDSCECQFYFKIVTDNCTRGQEKSRANNYILHKRFEADKETGWYTQVGMSSSMS